jgi:hypothetical protein
MQYYAYRLMFRGATSAGAYLHRARRLFQAGGQRDMSRRYHDAMTIVRRHGRPDFFITFTANPAWAPGPRSPRRCCPTRRPPTGPTWWRASSSCASTPTWTTCARAASLVCLWTLALALGFGVRHLDVEHGQPMEGICVRMLMEILRGALLL